METADARPRSGEPIAIGEFVLRNRLVMTPHLGRLSPERLRHYLERRARGGVAMAVLPAGQLVYGASTYPSDVASVLGTADAELDDVPFHHGDPRFADTSAVRFSATLAGMARALHRHGAVAVAQIHHPGPEQSWEAFQPTVAPSEIPGEDTGRVPHELSRDEIADLAAGYVASAVLIAESEMDGLELHAGHGYLLNRFLSPRYNRRRDEYGGSVQARARFLVDLVDRIRTAIGPRPMIGVRLPAPEEVDGGLTAADLVLIAGALAGSVSYLNLSLGNHDGLRDGRPATPYTSPWLLRDNGIGPTGAAIRSAVDVPVVVTGRITTAEQAESLLASGAADLVGSARAYIADPDFAGHVARGRGDLIDRCIGCNECTLVPMSCPVNPEAGRERQLRTPPTVTPRRIVVVGAGPAGAEFAVRSAERGNDVALLDAGRDAGGLLAVLTGTETLAPWTPLLERLRSRVHGSAVRFEAGQRVSAEEVLDLEPDVVVVATGSRPRPAAFAGDGALLTSIEVLSGADVPADGPIAVVGGAEPHLEPLVVAHELAGRGRQVILLSEQVAVGGGVEPRTATVLLGRMLRRGVRLEPMRRVLGWQDGVLHTEQLFAGTHDTIEAAAVVLAHGRRACSGLARDLADRHTATYVIGDALAPRRLSHATLEGARFALAL